MTPASVLLDPTVFPGLKFSLQSAMVNLPRPNKSIHIHHALRTTKTRAQFWNMGDLGAQEEFLDDTGLRAKLEKLVG